MQPTEHTEAAPSRIEPLTREQERDKRYAAADADAAAEAQLRSMVRLMDVVLPASGSSLLAAGTLNGTANVTKPETGIREHVAADALRKLVREFATDIREKGYSVDELKLSPEWQESRALYFVYCGGFEDALYESRAVLAAAVCADKPAWVGDVVLHAWYEYADDGIEKMIAQEQP